MSQLTLIPLVVAAMVAGIVALVLMAVVLAAAIGRARIRRSHRPTGRLVMVAGTRLHVVRRGPTDGPIVVLVAGVGGVAAGWSGIQGRLDQSIASLAYDRAGLGWSEPAPGPRTIDALADELLALLHADGIVDPVIVVGHSLGGIVARRLAARHPGSVSGIVLVDSAHEEQYERIPEVRRVARRMVSVPAAVSWLMGVLSVLRRPPLEGRLPGSDADEVRAAMSVSSAHLPTAMAEMRSVVTGEPCVDALGDLPLIVLRHGRRERMPMLTDAVNDRFEAAFAELQAELATRSTRGRLVVAEGSGHDIHLDDPDLVVAAIRDVVALTGGTSRSA